jgi:hypothetical protein
MKRQSTKWKIVANHISEKGLVPIKCIALLKLNSRRSNQFKKNGQRT